nr:hypothetical protein Iba_chr08aCG13820 [Ipomoea batatas]
MLTQCSVRGDVMGTESPYSSCLVVEACGGDEAKDFHPKTTWAATLQKSMYRTRLLAEIEDVDVNFEGLLTCYNQPELVLSNLFGIPKKIKVHLQTEAQISLTRDMRDKVINASSSATPSGGIIISLGFGCCIHESFLGLDA